MSLGKCRCLTLYLIDRFVLSRVIAGSGAADATVRFGRCHSRIVHIQTFRAMLWNGLVWFSPLRLREHDDQRRRCSGYRFVRFSVSTTTPRLYLHNTQHPTLYYIHNNSKKRGTKNQKAQQDTHIPRSSHGSSKAPNTNRQPGRSDNKGHIYSTTRTCRIAWRRRELGYPRRDAWLSRRRGHYRILGGTCRRLIVGPRGLRWHRLTAFGSGVYRRLRWRRLAAIRGRVRWVHRGTGHRVGCCILDVIRKDVRRRRDGRYADGGEDIIGVCFGSRSNAYSGRWALLPGSQLVIYKRSRFDGDTYASTQCAVFIAFALRSNMLAAHAARNLRY